MKKTDSVLDLIKLVRKAGGICSAQLPTEMVIGNIIRRVLFIIRDEYAYYRQEKTVKWKRTQHQQNQTTTSLSSTTTTTTTTTATPTAMKAFDNISSSSSSNGS